MVWTSVLCSGLGFPGPAAPDDSPMILPGGLDVSVNRHPGSAWGPDPWTAKPFFYPGSMSEIVNLLFLRMKKRPLRDTVPLWKAT